MLDLIVFRKSTERPTHTYIRAHAHSRLSLISCSVPLKQAYNSSNTLSEIYIFTGKRSDFEGDTWRMGRRMRDMWTHVPLWKRCVKWSWLVLAALVPLMNVGRLEANQSLGTDLCLTSATFIFLFMVLLPTFKVLDYLTTAVFWKSHRNVYSQSECDQFVRLFRSPQGALVDWNYWWPMFFFQALCVLLFMCIYLLKNQLKYSNKKKNTFLVGKNLRTVKLFLTIFSSYIDSVLFWTARISGSKGGRFFTFAVCRKCALTLTSLQNQLFVTSPRAYKSQWKPSQTRDGTTCQASAPTCWTLWTYGSRTGSVGFGMLSNFKMLLFRKF